MRLHVPLDQRQHPYTTAPKKNRDGLGGRLLGLADLHLRSSAGCVHENTQAMERAVFVREGRGTGLAFRLQQVPRPGGMLCSSVTVRYTVLSFV